MINIYKICYSRQRQTCLLQQHAPCLCSPGAGVRLWQREHVQGLMWCSSLTPSPRGGSGLLRNGSGSACVRRTVAGRISRLLESYKADDSDGCLTCGLSPHIINITCKLSLLKHPHIIMHQRTRLSVSSLLVAPLGCMTPSQICTLLWGGWCEYDQFPGYFTIS